MFDNIDKATEQRILRYVFAVGISSFIAIWFNWPLAFCAPLFTAKFMVDKPHFTRLHILQLLFALVASFMVSVVVSTGLPEYHIAFLAIYAGGLLWGYYLITDPKWQMFATFWIINLILTPSVTIIDQQAALDIGFGMAFSGVLAVLICFVAHIYFPEDNVQAMDKFPPSPLSHDMRWSASLQALMVSFPLVVFYFYYQLSQVLLTVAFVILLSLLTNADKAGKTSVFFVLSNIVGGLFAFVAFMVISIAPNMLVYMLVVLLVIILFATKIYTDPGKAPIFTTGFTGFVVLMGTSMSSGALDDKFFLRIWQLLLVIVYLVFMTYFMEGRSKAKD